jgi:hypothetical protein
MDDHHHNYITKTKPNHKTNKQSNTCSFPQQRKLLFQRIFQVTCLGRKGGWGQVTATHVPKDIWGCHFSTWEPRDVDHGIWIPACEVSNLDWLAVCLSAFLFFARALAFCGVCVPLFFLLALSESASPLRHKKDCFPFSTASKNSLTCI